MQNRSLPSSFVLAMMLVLPLSGFTAYQDKQAQGLSVRLPSAVPLTALLDAAPGSELPQALETAWLAWLLWWNAPVQVQAGGAEGEWTVQAPAADAAEPAPPPDWLERMIEQLTER